MQWGPFLPKGGGMIQVDIGDHLPIPPSQFHQFSYLLFFTVFRLLNFRGCFESLNSVVIRDIFPTRYHTRQMEIL